MAKAKKLKVLFLSEKSILDFHSGAALELMDWFRYLTKAGHSCYSFSFSCFDGVEEYPVKELVSKEIDLARDHGRLCNLTVDGIHHTLLLTKSTDTKKLGDPELMAFNMNAKKHLDQVKPDVVILFGSKYLEPLIKHAKAGGARTCFYLATGVYGEDGRKNFELVDDIIVPSETLKAHYKEKLGLTKMRVIPVSPNHSFERKAEELPNLAANRKERFVTMINPDVAKGGLVFINIAHRFLSLDPSITFLAVESRGKRADWEAQGIDTSALKNLWWIPKQADISHVFRKTSVLIVPSIAYEAAGKVIAEAMVCGIPVIGSDRGGIKAQMRGTGRTIELPAEVLERPSVMPVPYIDTWVSALKDLLDDEKTYLEASKAALKAGQVYSRSRISKEVVQFFEKG